MAFAELDQVRDKNQQMTAIGRTDDAAEPIGADEAGWVSGVEGEAHPLVADVHGDGFGFEWHCWSARAPVQWWSKSRPFASLLLHLNIEGSGQAGCSAGGRSELCPRTAGFCCCTGCAFQNARAPGKHRFLIVEYSRGFLADALGRYEVSHHPLIARFVAGDHGCCGAATIGPLTCDHQEFVLSLRHPTVPDQARKVWYRGKALEAIAEFLFPRPEEMFCTRQKRLAKERVERVVKMLRQNLAEAPTLDELSRQVGCSPFYLSRTFSKEMGMTIPQFLRQLRMEKAAELLASGRFNVTETAMEVGYSSVSHFSQTFCQTIGCCPNLYPHAQGRMRRD